MNLREAVENYAKAASDRDYYDNRGDTYSADEAAEQARQWRQVVDLQLAVAEAAMAHAEFQVSSHSRNGDDAPMDGATYIRERGRLWEAFMQAHKAAKDANQS